MYSHACSFATDDNATAQNRRSVRVRSGIRRPNWTSVTPLFLLLVATLATNLDAADLEGTVKRLIRSHRGKVAVFVKHLENGETISHLADEVMPTASMIKVAVMAEAFRQAEAGQVDLDSKITLKDEDKAPGSGVLTSHFSSGTSISLRDAIRLMIVYSDNTATNLVLSRIGLASTNETMKSWELPNTRIHAMVYRRDTSLDLERSKKYGLGSTTAAEMGRLFERLHQRKLVSQDASDKMLAHLQACEDRSKLMRFLPAGVKVAHKSGSVARTRCDVALVESRGGPFVVCVMTTENDDRSWGPENRADLLCARIGQAVYLHFNPNTSPAVDDGPLSTGASGELVEHLQRTLNARLKPSPELAIDGDFGPATRAAVVRLQEKHQLKSTGQVDEKTWKALGKLITKDSPVADPDVVNSQQLPKQPVDEVSGRPFVTCKAWAIGDAESGELLWENNASKRLDIASTTKIMTAYLVLSLAKENPEVLQETVVFSERADRTPGSTAGVRAGERVPVSELMFGLLLPSGNDASVALAEHFGARFPSSDEKKPSKEKESSDTDDPLELFVAEMNRRAKQLGMNDTTFANPHGLTAAGHRSTAHDMLRLTTAALKLPEFARRVSTRQRGVTLEAARGYQRNIIWKNTNRLLAIEGYFGVKTGTTGAAGACLVSGANRKGRRLILVVLGSSSSDGRYADSRNLYRWAWSQLDTSDKN